MTKRTYEQALRLLFYSAYFTSFIVIAVSFLQPNTFRLEDTIYPLSGQLMFLVGFICAFLVTASIALLVIGGLTHKFQISFPKRIFFASALFTITVAVWIFFGSGAAIHFGLTIQQTAVIDYFCFMLMPLSFAYSLKGRTKELTYFSYIFTTIFLCLFYFCTIWLATVRTYPSVLPYIHGCIFVMLLVGSGVSLLNYLKERELDRLNLTIGFFILTLCVCIALESFLHDAANSTGFVFIIGMGLMLFILFLVMGLLRSVMRSIEKARSFEAAAAAIPGGVYRAKWDENFTIRYANDAFYKLYGFKNEEQAQAASFTSRLLYMDAPDVQAMRTKLESAKNNGQNTCEFETHERDKNGAYKWLLSTVTYHKETNELFASVNDITKRHLAEEKLRMKEQEYAHVINSTGKLVVRYDVKERKLFLETRAMAEFGLPAILQNVPESIVQRAVVSPEQVENYVQFYRQIQQGEAHGETTLRIKSARKKDWAWYKMIFAAIMNDAGESSYALISFTDVTEQREKEIAYEKLQLEYAAIPFDEIGVYECNLTRNTVDYVYGGLRSYSKKRRALSFEEQTNMLKQYVLPKDRSAYLKFFHRETLIQAYDRGHVVHSLNYRTTYRHNRTTGWQNTTIQLVPYSDVDEVKAFIVVRDITEEKEKESELLQKVEIDALTGIYNRAAIEERINKVLESTEKNSVTAVIMMDIDKFKGINDTFGHQQGDDIIRRVAQTLLRLKRGSDLAGRLGGDEFILCLTNIPADTDLHRRLDSILGSMHFEISHGVFASCSFGVALAPEDGEDFETLYKKADKALYYAKENGRWRYAVYDDVVDEDISISV